VPAGSYASGLPFGLEFSGRPWADGDLLGVAFAWEKAGTWRKPPTLVESGLLPVNPARPGRPGRVTPTTSAR
jgi:amidase